MDTTEGLTLATTSAMLGKVKGVVVITGVVVVVRLVTVVVAVVGRQGKWDN